MTDYSNEQNNVFGEVQPMEAPSVEAEPVAVAEPQPVAPVVDTPAEIPPVVEPVIAVEAPAFVAEAVAQPQVAEPVAPTYQEPVQPQVAEPVVPVYQAPVYQETVPPAQIPVAPTYQAPAEPQPPKKSSAPIVVGILAVLLVIALAVILVFALGDKDGSDDKNGKGNKKETEQVDDTDSSEDDDADEDDKTDKDDTNKDDKDNNKDDKNDKNDKNENTDDDDTSVIAPAAKGYTEYLDAFCGFCCGDVYQFERLLPEALWDIMRVACAEELGYLPTKEEVIELMLSETEDLEFLDETTYDILSESVADDRDVRMMQNALMEVLVLDEIEEAYELHIKWTMKADGKSLEYEERVYAIYFDGEWTLMSENYIPYCMDMEEFGQEMENTFGANYI